MQWSLKLLVISASSWFWIPTMVGSLLMLTSLTSPKPLPIVLHGYPRSGTFLFHFLTSSAVPSLYLWSSLGTVGDGGLALQLISFYFNVMISGLPQDSPLIFKSLPQSCKAEYVQFFSFIHNLIILLSLKYCGHIKGSWEKKSNKLIFKDIILLQLYCY